MMETPELLNRFEESETETCKKVCLLLVVFYFIKKIAEKMNIAAEH